MTNYGHVLGELAGSRRMLLHIQQRAGGGSHLEGKTIQDVIQSMSTVLENNPVKFHRDPI